MLSAGFLRLWRGKNVAVTHHPLGADGPGSSPLSLRRRNRTNLPRPHGDSSAAATNQPHWTRGGHDAHLLAWRVAGTAGQVLSSRLWMKSTACAGSSRVRGGLTDRIQAMVPECKSGDVGASRPGGRLGCPVVWPLAPGRLSQCPQLLLVTRGPRGAAKAIDQEPQSPGSACHLECALSPPPHVPTGEDTRTL